MPYFFEEDYAVFGEQRIDEALRRWKPGKWTQFVSAAEETFMQYNTLGYVGSTLAEWSAPDETPIAKENWNVSHPAFREDINYTDGMTEGEALVRATQSDRNYVLSVQRQNVDFWSLPNLTGALLGGLPDPVNLIGAGGVLGRAGRVKKLAEKMPVIRHTAPVLQGASDTALAESVFQFTRLAVESSQGGDLDQFAVLNEIGLASAFGGLFSTFPMAWQVAKKAPEIMHYTWLAEASNQIGRQGDSVTVFGRQGMNEDPIDPATAQKNNKEKLHEELSREDLEDVTDADTLFEGERREIDDRVWSETLADDVLDAASSPRETIRNGYEKLIQCVRQVGRKFS